MYNLIIKFLIFVFIYASAFVFVVATEPLDVLIDNVVERSRIIQSGVFRFTAYTSSDDNPVITCNADLDTCNFGLKVMYHDLAICIRGNECSQHRNQVTYFNTHRIIKDDYEAEYDGAIPRSDGTTARLYYMTPKHSDISDLLSPSYDFQVAGRLQSDLLCDYILKHKNEAKDMGLTTLANGDVVRHVQFVIPKEYQYYVLIFWMTTGDGDYGFDTMLLNLYVMPEKGYVLRRIDECDPHGKVIIRCESFDFVDRGNGIFFPNVFMHIAVCSGNRERTHRHEFKEVLLVNEPIPDRYFDRELPKGTTVRDWRDTSVDEDHNPRFFCNITRRYGF
jgi:hypothetical protein